MVRMDIVYEGEFRCRTRHQKSEVILYTDAPADNFGKGESFSPTDLCAASLGVCAITTMAIKTKDLHLNLRGTELKIEKHMTEAPPRKIARIVVEFNMPEGIPEDKREALRKIAEDCPVALSLSPEVEKVFIFNYNG